MIVSFCCITFVAVLYCSVCMHYDVYDSFVKFLHIKLSEMFTCLYLTVE